MHIINKICGICSRKFPKETQVAVLSLSQHLDNKEIEFLGLNSFTLYNVKSHLFFTIKE